MNIELILKNLRSALGKQRLPNYHIVILYAECDTQFAVKLAKLFREHEIKTWTPEENLLPGQDWDLETMVALRESDFVIAVNSEESGREEGEFAKNIKRALKLQEEKLDGGIKIIPVCIEDCDIAEKLMQFQPLNLHVNDQAPRLLIAWQAEFSRRERKKIKIQTTFKTKWK